MGLAIKEKSAWLSVLSVLPNSKDGTGRQGVGWEHMAELDLLQVILTSFRWFCFARLHPKMIRGQKTIRWLPVVPMWQWLRSLRLCWQLPAFHVFKPRKHSLHMAVQWGRQGQSLWNQIRIPTQPLPTCAPLSLLLNLSRFAYLWNGITNIT